MSYAYTLLVTLATLGVLVTIHEWGHFFVARRCGVRVLRFSIGFGTPLFRWQDRLGTEYAIAWLPFGGYVKMLDEREGPVDVADQPCSFNRQPVSRRMAISAAGPVANLLLAVVVLWAVYLGGVRGLAPVIDEVEPGSLAEHAGLEAGQEVVEVDGEPTPTWAQFDWQLLRRIGDSGKMVIGLRYPGSDLVYQSTVEIDQWMAEGDTPAPHKALGIKLRVPELPSIVESITPGSPAQAAGFKPGDRVLQADGHDVQSWDKWVDYVRARPGQPIAVQVERGQESLSLQVTPAAVHDENGNTTGQVGMGVHPEWPAELLREYHYSPVTAWRPAVVDCWHYTTLTLDSLHKMLVGMLSPRHLSGPVTIAKVAGSSARAGWQAYLEFLAMLSVSLAVINLLPVPVLDGGHLLLYGLEGIMGRPVPERLQQWAFQLGVSIIIGITILALFNDLSRL